MKLEQDPARPRGLYCYDVESALVPRTWRPDMDDLALLWLATLPAEDWYLYGVRIEAGDRGEFVARFRMPPQDPMQPTQTVTFRLDHEYSQVSNDHRQWATRKFIGYQRNILHAAANIPVGSQERDLPV